MVSLLNKMWNVLGNLCNYTHLGCPMPSIVIKYSYTYFALIKCKIHFRLYSFDSKCTFPKDLFGQDYQFCSNFFSILHFWDKVEIFNNISITTGNISSLLLSISAPFTKGKRSLTFLMKLCHMKKKTVVMTWDLISKQSVNKLPYLNIMYKTKIFKSVTSSDCLWFFLCLFGNSILQGK